MCSDGCAVDIEGIDQKTLNQKFDIDRVGIGEIQSCIGVEEGGGVEDSRYVSVGNDDGSVSGDGDVFQGEGGGFDAVEGEGTEEVGVGEVGDFDSFVISQSIDFGEFQSSRGRKGESSKG